jgi:hypothetical protein
MKLTTAADCSGNADVIPQFAARIEHLDTAVLEWAAIAMEISPGNAVHCVDDRRVGSEQPANSLGGCGKACAFTAVMTRSCWPRSSGRSVAGSLTVRLPCGVSRA